MKYLQMTLTCDTCRWWQQFADSSAPMAGAASLVPKAKKAGWLFTDSRDREREYCPKCAAKMATSENKKG